MSYLDLAEELVINLITAYTSDRNTQYEPATGNATPPLTALLQTANLCQDLLFDIDRLRNQIVDVNPQAPTASDRDVAATDSSAVRNVDNEESTLQSASKDYISADIIEDICKQRLLALFSNSMMLNDHELNPTRDQCVLRAVQHHINLTTALLQTTPDPQPIPKDISDIAQSSPLVNKCLATLQSLGRLDLEALRLTPEVWPRWRSDRVAALNDVIAATGQRHSSSISLTDEDKALEALSKISVAVGIPVLSGEMLTRLEQASEWWDGSDMFLEKKMLQKIRSSLEKQDIMSLPLFRFADICEVCSQISLQAIAGDSSYSAKTCVRMLRCAQFTGDNQVYPIVATENVCSLGAFLFENSTVMMSPIHFIRLGGPSTVLGCLELGLVENSQDWDGLTKTLKTTGFDNCDNSTISFDVAATPKSRAAMILKKRRISPILSSTTIGLIEEWLRICDSCHEECDRWAHKDQQTRGQAPTLPTRVIDLGTGTDPNIPPRLIMTKGAKGKYAALSYCWGDDVDTFSTTNDNINDMIEEIPRNRLPAAFVNAMEISRRLNVRYLWIDALCIIQDDIEDWDAEARKMGSVYQSAHVTIAATCSSQASQPFLPIIEDSPRQKYFDLPCEPNRPEAGTFSLVVGSRPDAKTQVKNTRLNSRGWVLQERLLSHRVLHFASDQIYWECRREAKAEDGSAFPSQYLDKDFLFPLPGWMKKIDIESLNEYTPQKDEMFQRAWLALLEFYALCQFSRASDRLVALSNLVDKLRPFTKRTYVDGNWFLPGSRTLPQSLFWRPEDSCRSFDPTAPSWSWTSRVGKLDFAFHNRGYTSQVTLVSIEEEYEGSRRSLHLKGEIFTANVGKARGRSNDLLRPGSDESKDACIGSMHLDDFHRATPDTVECLSLFDDVAEYPIYWALRAVSEVGELTVYERIGIATQPRNTTCDLESKEFLLI